MNYFINEEIADDDMDNFINKVRYHGKTFLNVIFVTNTTLNIIVSINIKN